MKKIIFFSTLLLSLLSSASTFAAEDAELKVKGSIRPGSCSPSFAGGNVIDYGRIPPSSLNATGKTNLATRQVQVVVNCDGPTVVFIKLQDNRADSVATSVADEGSFGSNRDTYLKALLFGLGKVRGKTIGGYTVAIDEWTGDGTRLSSFTANNRITGNSDYWLQARPTDGAFPSLYYRATLAENVRYFFPAQTHRIKLSIKTMIQDKKDLDLSSEIPLDGSMTFEVSYL